jgi:hypothetical protein
MSDEHSEHSALHWLFERAAEESRKGFFVSTGKLIGAGLILGASVVAVNESYAYLKHRYSQWACHDGVATGAGDGGYRLPLVKQTADDERGVQQVRQILQTRLPNNVSPIEICRPLSSSSDGGPAPHKTIDAIRELQHSFGAPLVISVGQGNDGYSSLGFWPKENETFQEPASFNYYRLNDPAEQRKFVMEIKKHIFLNETARSRPADDVFPIAYRKAAEAAGATRRKKLEILLHEPIDPETACGIGLVSANAKFDEGNLLSAREDFAKIGKSACPDGLKVHAHDRLGHTCLKLMALKTDVDTSIGALKCAETSLEIVAIGALSGGRESAAVLISKHNLNYARFELSELTKDPMKRQQALQGSQEVRESILDLKRGAPGADISVLATENLDLTERLTPKKPADTQIVEQEVTPRPQSRKAEATQKTFAGRRKHRTAQHRGGCNISTFRTLKPAVCHGPSGEMFVMPSRTFRYSRNGGIPPN